MGDLAKGKDVLFLSPVGTLGGAERVLLSLLLPCQQIIPDFSVRVVCLDEGPLFGELKELGIPVSLQRLPGHLGKLGDTPAGKQGSLARLARLMVSAPSIFALIFKWKKWLSQESPVWIHSNGFKTHLLSAWAANTNTPIFWHLHDFVGERPLMRKLLKAAWRPGIQALAISQAVADDFSKVLPNCPVRVWFNTIDCEKFQPRVVNGSWLDAQSGTSEGFKGIRVGLVATYARWKGHEVFLHACSLLVKKFGNKVRFYVIGGPVYKTSGSQWSEDELREKIRGMDLGDSVSLVPFQKDTARVYQSLNVVVHASTRREPFGLVIGEAMACGKPVVAALHGGAAEIGRDGIDCVGHEPGNPVSLAAGIELLIQNDTRRKELEANARPRILKHFGPEKIFEQWHELLGEVEKI